MKVDLPTTKTRPRVDLKEYISLFYGQPGVGKTTFVNHFSPNVLFLSTDRGTRFMEAMRVECLTWHQFNSVLVALEKPNTPNYDFICIDHVDDWASMAEQAVLEQCGIQALADAGYGKGWSMYKKALTSSLQRMKRLHSGIVFIAHEITKTVKVRGFEIDKCVPMMNKQAWGAIIPLCDVVGYCGMRAMKKGGKRIEVRTLETVPRDDLYVKDRTARPLPQREWEELDGHKFVQSFGVSHGTQKGKGKKAGRRARG